jgi:hypothetical protein
VQNFVARSYSVIIEIHGVLVDSSYVEYTQCLASSSSIIYLWPDDRGRNMLSPCHLK